MKTNILDYLQDIAKIILAIIFWPITIFYFLIKIINKDIKQFDKQMKEKKEGKWNET